MNIFRFELKRSLASMAGWTLTILVCISLFMQGMYPIYQDSAKDILVMLASFPKEFLVAFGFSDKMFSYEGFYAFGFTYLTLLGAMFATSVTLQVFAREKRCHCQEFLYAKPVTRGRMLGQKLSAVLVVLLVSNGLIVGWALAVAKMAGENEILGRIGLASFNLLFTELLFMSFAMLYAVQVRRVRTISGTAMAFAFAGYILTAMAGVIDKVEMRYIAPFKYFDPYTAVVEGHFETQYVVTAVALFVIFMVAAIYRYCTKDVRE